MPVVGQTNYNVQLQEAVASGNWKAAKQAIQNGAIVDCRGVNQWTPLMLAVQNNHAQVAKELLARRADPLAKTISGWTPLMIAAYRGATESVQMLLEELAKRAKEYAQMQVRDISPSTTPAGGSSPASSVGSSTTSGASTESKEGEASTSQTKSAAERLAADRQLEEEMWYSLQVNASSDAEDTPLTLATLAGHVEVVKILCEGRAAVGLVNGKGLTALDIARREAAKEWVRQRRRDRVRATPGTHPVPPYISPIAPDPDELAADMQALLQSYLAQHNSTSTTEGEPSQVNTTSDEAKAVATAAQACPSPPTRESGSHNLRLSSCASPITCAANLPLDMQANLWIESSKLVKVLRKYAETERAWLEDLERRRLEHQQDLERRAQEEQEEQERARETRRQLMQINQKQIDARLLAAAKRGDMLAAADALYDGASTQYRGSDGISVVTAARVSKYPRTGAFLEANTLIAAKPPQTWTANEVIAWSEGLISAEIELRSLSRRRLLWPHLYAEQMAAYAAHLIDSDGNAATPGQGSSGSSTGSVGSSSFDCGVPGRPMCSGYTSYSSSVGAATFLSRSLAGNSQLQLSNSNPPSDQPSDLPESSPPHSHLSVNSSDDHDDDDSSIVLSPSSLRRSGSATFFAAAAAAAACTSAFALGEAAPSTLLTRQNTPPHSPHAPTQASLASQTAAQVQANLVAGRPRSRKVGGRHSDEDDHVLEEVPEHLDEVPVDGDLFADSSLGDTEVNATTDQVGNPESNSESDPEPNLESSLEPEKDNLASDSASSEDTQAHAETSSSQDNDSASTAVASGPVEPSSTARRPSDDAQASTPKLETIRVEVSRGGDDDDESEGNHVPKHPLDFRGTSVSTKSSTVETKDVSATISADADLASTLDDPLSVPKTSAVRPVPNGPSSDALEGLVVEEEDASLFPEELPGDEDDVVLAAAAAESAVGVQKGKSPIPRMPNESNSGIKATVVRSRSNTTTGPSDTDLFGHSVVLSSEDGSGGEHKVTVLPFPCDINGTPAPLLINGSVPSGTFPAAASAAAAAGYVPSNLTPSSPPAPTAKDQAPSPYAVTERPNFFAAITMELKRLAPRVDGRYLLSPAFHSLIHASATHLSTLLRKRIRAQSAGDGSDDEAETDSEKQPTPFRLTAQERLVLRRAVTALAHGYGSLSTTGSGLRASARSFESLDNIERLLYREEILYWRDSIRREMFPVQRLCPRAFSLSSLLPQCLVLFRMDVGARVGVNYGQTFFPSITTSSKLATKSDGKNATGASTGTGARFIAAGVTPTSQLLRWWEPMAARVVGAPSEKATARQAKHKYSMHLICDGLSFLPIDATACHQALSFCDHRSRAHNVVTQEFVVEASDDVIVQCAPYLAYVYYCVARQLDLISGSSVMAALGKVLAHRGSCSQNPNNISAAEAERMEAAGQTVPPTGIEKLHRDLEMLADANAHLIAEDILERRGMVPLPTSLTSQASLVGSCGAAALGGAGDPLTSFRHDSLINRHTRDIERVLVEDQSLNWELEAENMLRACGYLRANQTLRDPAVAASIFENGRLTYARNLLSQVLMRGKDSANNRWRPPSSTAGLIRIKDTLRRRYGYMCPRHTKLAEALDKNRFVRAAPNDLEYMDPTAPDPDPKSGRKKCYK